MVEKKVKVKGHERQTDHGTEHVKQHSRKMNVKPKAVPNQEIPEESQ